MRLLARLVIAMVFLATAPADALLAIESEAERRSRHLISQAKGGAPKEPDPKALPGSHELVVDVQTELCRTCGGPVWRTKRGWRHEAVTL